VLLEGGPTLAGAFLAGRPDRPGDRVRRAELLGTRRTALVDAGVTTIADRIDLDSSTSRGSGPTCASPHRSAEAGRRPHPPPLIGTEAVRAPTHHL